MGHVIRNQNSYQPLVADQWLSLSKQAIGLWEQTQDFHMSLEGWTRDFSVNFQVRTRIFIMSLDAGQGLMGATAPTWMHLGPALPTTNPTWVNVCETIIDLNPTNTLPNPPLIVEGQAKPVPI